MSDRSALAIIMSRIKESISGVGNKSRTGATSGSFRGAQHKQLLRRCTPTEFEPLSHVLKDAGDGVDKRR